MSRVFTMDHTDMNGETVLQEDSAHEQDSNNAKVSPPVAPPPWRRSDVWAWLGSLAFLAVLIGMIFVAGRARGWDAESGYTHNTSATSADRFLPEPYREEEGVRGRYGEDATGRWYYWKVPPDTTTTYTRLFCWLCYIVHQVLIWAVIYHAQLVKAREPLGRGRYTTQMRSFNWMALGINIFFHLLHFVNTHATYDGLAQDVSISSSQGSVIMLVVLCVMVEYKDRGLAFGWPTTNNTWTCSKKIRLSYTPVNLVRRFHGYAFAWAAVYTFWYHPMENTVGHVMGFVYTYIILLQGALMYTDLHLNKYWRLLQELWVVIHGGVVAWQTGGPDLKGTKLWPMFVFGFSLCFVVTQIFSLPLWAHIPSWCRVFPLLVYIGVTLWCYSWIPNSEGRTWSRLDELIRIPGVYYLFFLVGWALLLAFLAIERKCTSRGQGSRSPQDMSPLKQTMWLSAAVLIYALHVGISVAIEIGDVKMGLITLMIIFVAIFMVGCCVSFMFLKQVVPLRIQDGKTTDSVDENKDTQCLGTNESLPMEEKGGPDGHPNPNFTDYL